MKYFKEEGEEGIHKHELIVQYCTMVGVDDCSGILIGGNNN